jgi:DNA-directed RNA polymerase subunit H (RpoH/RPB5)
MSAASASSNRIQSLYKSRTTILQLLDHQNYDVDDYDGFSGNEIDAMYVNSQLDMLISRKTDDRKVYIKYYFSPKQTSKQIRPQNLDDIIEDLFVIENVLTKNDTLIIIIDGEPNDTIITKMKYLYDHDGIFVIIHNIQRLQFNLLQHKLVPKITVLNTNEVDKLKQNLSLSTVNLLPEISRFDPQALAICLRPGSVCKFARESATALTYNYYRVCI